MPAQRMARRRQRMLEVLPNLMLHAQAPHQRLIEVIVQLCALALEREENRSRIRQPAFYDSLTELPCLSPQKLKLDRRFVSDLQAWLHTTTPTP